MVDVGDDAVIDRHGFDVLIEVLRGRGLRTMGPIVRDGAIVHGELATTADLPEGWHDHTEPGKYRLTHDGSSELFGWAVGPASWKSEFFLPAETVWRATVEEGEVALSDPRDEGLPVAVIGARPCEVAALGTLDRVLRDGEVPDDRYAGAVTEHSSWPSSAGLLRAPASAPPWEPALGPAPGMTWP